jgi:hypothetical protein
MNADGVPVLGLRPRQAAEALGLSERGLDELRKRGQAPPSVLLGRARIYPTRLLMEHLEALAEVNID